MSFVSRKNIWCQKFLKESVLRKKKGAKGEDHGLGRDLGNAGRS